MYESINKLRPCDLVISTPITTTTTTTSVGEEREDQCESIADVQSSDHNLIKNEPVIEEAKLNLKANQEEKQIMYDLVGIVVHSGQANAGHYYSFIKGNVINQYVKIFV